VFSGVLVTSYISWSNESEYLRINKPPLRAPPPPPPHDAGGKKEGGSQAAQKVQKSRRARTAKKHQPSERRWLLSN